MEHHHIFLLNNNLLNLKTTFENGQVFNYRKVSDDKYVWMTRGRKWIIENEGEWIKFHDIDEQVFLEEVVTMFDFDVNYDKIFEDIDSSNRDILLAIESYQGMRILKQEPWETVLSFIISANNNVSKIRMSVKALCEKFGEDLGDGDYSWPSPEALYLQPLEEIRVKALGYRDKYVLGAAEFVMSGKVNLYSENISYNDLMVLPGVGRKVADCILLFGYHHLEVVPVDTWVKKIGKTLFQQDKPDGIKKAFREVYGDYAGIAQQYLFHYYRTNSKS